jgi:endonuclease YncB( thermonuclease family)
MSQALLATLLLLAALVLYLVSTRQIQLGLRTVLVVIGTGFLALSAFLAWGSEGSAGFLRLAADFIANIFNPGESVVGQALSRNAGLAAQHVGPLFGLFLLLTGVLGFFAIIALTPGDKFDRMVRSALRVVLGMMVGAALALSLVAIGFGGPMKQRAYIGMVADPKEVHDGDTFLLGDVSIRLWGVDAPERDQECNDRGQCGAWAKEHLEKLLLGRIVQCTAPPNLGVDVMPRESFGRPLLVCRTLDDPQKGAGYDVGARMIRDGYAIVYRGSAPVGAFASYEGPQADAATASAGIMNRCWLDPKKWRSDPDARAAFIAGKAAPQDLIGGGCKRP